jgi:hypothetical protein
MAQQDNGNQNTRHENKGHIVNQDVLQGLCMNFQNLDTLVKKNPGTFM